MVNESETLHIAEIPYESGAIHFRYARRLSDDRSRWIRHGLFVEYFQNGVVASEGEYLDGVEEGIWRDFFENGIMAAEGRYVNGKEHGLWRFWNDDGSPEASIEFQNGEKIGS